MNHYKIANHLSFLIFLNVCLVFHNEITEHYLIKTEKKPENKKKILVLINHCQAKLLHSWFSMAHTF